MEVRMAKAGGAESRILVIYTGGTIGMRHSAGGYAPQSGFLTQTLRRMGRFHSPDGEGLVGVGGGVAGDATGARASDESISVQTPSGAVDLPTLITPLSLFDRRVRYAVLEYSPLLDSANMTMADWAHIASDIEANYKKFDAFIILHGTDTMAYSASALSFMLEDLGKTVIITGSQVPLAEHRNDAVDNFLCALTIAGHFVIPEVGLYFNNKLFRGNRSTKIDAVDFNAFDSPNLPPLVNVGINIDVNWQLVRRPASIAKFRAWKVLNPNVATLRLFPGITDSTVRAFLAPPIQGVVLETYGAGNCPNNRPEILKLFKEASARGVVIVNTTQCKRGNVSDLYETGRALLDCGVIPGGNMTPECALTKLSYLLGHGFSDEVVRRLARKNLRGELTIKSSLQQFEFSPHTKGLVYNFLTLLGLSPEALAASPKSPTGHKRRRSRPNIELDLDEDQITSLERTLIPSVLCQCAKQGDTDGLLSILEHFGSYINLSDYDARTPLHIAASEGNFSVVERLLLHGSMVHLRDRRGHSPLWDAVRCRHIPIVALLVKCGAHFSNEETKDVVAFAEQCAREADVVGLEACAIAGADMGFRDSQGRGLIALAAFNGHLSVLEYLASLPRPAPPLPLLIPDEKEVLENATTSTVVIPRATTPSLVGSVLSFKVVDVFGKSALDYAKFSNKAAVVAFVEDRIRFGNGPTYKSDLKAS